MSSTFRLNVSFPDRRGPSLDAESVTLPTAAGQITVLAGHADLITVVVPGRVTVRAAGDVSQYSTGEGVLYIRSGEAHLAVSEFEAFEAKEE